MGEFKRRIKEEIDFDNYIGWKEEEAFRTMREKVLEVVEDAKKEFPYVISKEGFFHLKPEFATQHNAGKQMVELIREWFERYFGE